MTFTAPQPLDQLEYSRRVLKRAQYEAFEFSLIEGDVRVRNASHADPAAHEYRVRIDDEHPVACTCPFDTRADTACKHRVAVAIRPKLLDAAAMVHTLTEARSRPQLE
jgi:hypothetical protein